MDVVELIQAHGGCMRWGQIESHVSERQLRRAVQTGVVLRFATGTYCLPEASHGSALAQQFRGVQSHRSAAAHWGFALPPGPHAEHITIKSNARRRSSEGVVLHYRNLATSDVAGQVTTPARTVIDCLRELCLRDALAVGDSALRSRLVRRDELAVRAALVRGPGSATLRQRVDLLDARAENAFESSCRAILIQGKVSGFSPQLSISHDGWLLARVDLGNALLLIVLECESFAHHGDRAALRRDCRRYTELEAAGWLVLRVTWEHVMFQPDWVLARVRDAVSVAQRRGRKEQRPRKRPSTGW